MVDRTKGGDPNSSDVLLMNEDALGELMEHADKGPFVVMALVRIRTDSSESAAYDFAQRFSRLLRDYEATHLFYGRPAAVLMGTLEWDLVVSARFPRREKLLEMMSSQEFMPFLEEIAGLVEDRKVFLLDPKALGPLRLLVPN